MQIIKIRFTSRKKSVSRGQTILEVTLTRAWNCKIETFFTNAKYSLWLHVFTFFSKRVVSNDSACRQNKLFSSRFSKDPRTELYTISYFVIHLKTLDCCLLIWIGTIVKSSRSKSSKFHQGQYQVVVSRSKSRFKIKVQYQKVQKSRFNIKKFKSNCAFATPRHASAMCQRVNI